MRMRYVRREPIDAGLASIARKTRNLALFSAFVAFSTLVSVYLYGNIWAMGAGLFLLGLAIGLSIAWSHLMTVPVGKGGMTYSG